MKLMIVALALVALAAVAYSAPAESTEPPKVISQEFEHQSDGAYKSSFETENGIKQASEGQVKEVVDEKNEAHKVVVVRGFYEYLNKDGVQERVDYTADEDGYHPEGPSIPKA